MDDHAGIDGPERGGHLFRPPDRLLRLLRDTAPRNRRRHVPDCLASLRRLPPSDTRLRLVPGTLEK